jgi:hypothetical protein
MSTLSKEYLGTFTQSAYNQAKSTESNKDLADRIKAVCPGFPDKDAEVPEDIMTAIHAGYYSRFNELHPPRLFIVTQPTGTKAMQYTPVPPGEKPAKGLETVEIGLDVAMSMSRYDFGQLANEKSPLFKGTQYKEIIADIRVRLSTYCSNTFKPVRLAAMSETEKRTRQKAVGFSERLTKGFALWEKQVKIAQKNGDPAADPAKFKKAVAAFEKVWKG